MTTTVDKEKAALIEFISLSLDLPPEKFERVKGIVSTIARKDLEWMKAAFEGPNGLIELRHRFRKRLCTVEAREFPELYQQAAA